MDFSIVMIIISLSCLHICSGPDHYLPFITVSKSRGWGVGKTIGWTVACGIAHIAGSVLVSTAVIALGWGLVKIKWLEHLRGNIAGWALLLLGILYAAWGLWQAKRNRRHKHFDTYEDGTLYVYEHRHGTMVYPQQRYKVTPWVLFIIFALAPNEPMIPLLSILGIGHNAWSIAAFVSVYVTATVLAMLVMVLLGYYGLSFFKTNTLEKYLPVLGGLALILCGIEMVFM